MKQIHVRNRRIALPALLAAGVGLALAAQSATCSAQANDEKSIGSRIGGLRSVPDDKRGAATLQLALDIRKLTASGVRVVLADGLANLATEGDFGRKAVQEVATTLADALKAEPVRGSEANPASPYVTLAQLVRYEHATITLTDPQLMAALHQLDVDDAARDKDDFTLRDLQGTAWNLKSLKGKVVLVNFWATWCPPCRKEIPDLERLYSRFKDQGLIVLGISDENESKVKAFVAANSINYPVLIDAGHAVNTRFSVNGIPRTLIYDRDGKLAAEAIDMRTQNQLLDLLAQAGMK